MPIDKMQFCQKLESLLEMAPGTIHPDMRLVEDLEGWDSISVISFIAMIDQDYGTTVPPKAIAECQTVEDLAKLLMASTVG
jgi:acyl carrier protein